MSRMLILPTLLLILADGAAAAFSAKASSSRVFVGTPIGNRRLVSDCMTPSPQTLRVSNSVDEAIALLLECGYAAAPVVSDASSKTLLGIVTPFDFLQKEAGGGALLPMEGSVDQVEGYVEAATKICAQRVGDIMTPNPVTINPDTTMRAAAEVMAKERVNHLPVLDDSGSLVGILTSSNVMRDVLHVVRNLPEAKEEEEVGSEAEESVASP